MFVVTFGILRSSVDEVSPRIWSGRIFSEMASLKIDHNIIILVND